jgi:hypothetical protein
VNVASFQSGDYFISFGESSTFSASAAYRGRLHVKRGSIDVSKVQFGVSTSSGTAAYCSTEYSAGVTILLVVKHTFTATTSTTSLYINPSIDAEPVSPDVIDNTASTVSTGLNAIVLRQGGSSSAATLNVDGVRVGTGWGSVTGNPQYSVETSMSVGNYNTVKVLSGATTTLSGNVTIKGSLTLSSGKLNIGSNTLTLDGTVNNMSSLNCLVASNGSNITINGTGSLGTLFFDQTTPGTTNRISTFTLNRTTSGSASLGNGLLISSTLALTDGTLAIGANTLTLSGSSITRSTGTIDASNASATIAFTNTASLSIPASTFTGNISNLTINGAGGVTLGSNQNVTGTLALTSGKLDLSDKTLTYSGSSITRTSGSLDVDAGGIIFSNTSGLTLPTSTFNGDVKDLTLNGAGGVTIPNNQTITGTLTLTSGKLSVGSNTLTVSGSVSGGNADSYIQTNGTGKLVRNGITTSTFFPVGNAKYNPLTINNPDNLNWSVNVKDEITPDPGFPATGRVDLIWDITPSTTPTPSSTTITFQFDENTQVGSGYSGGTPLQAFRRNRYDEYWQPVGAPELRTGAAPANTVTISGLTNFSKYALSNVGSPLPVSLLSFSGYKDGSRNQLRWVTASETNNSGFEVQRSSDGINYSSLGFVNSLAIGGNSQSQLKYSFIDANPTGLKQYYRLKQMDIDGRSTLSNILLIQGDKPTAFEIASVYPNPSRGQVTVLLNAPENKAVTIRLIDLTGRTLQTKQINALAGNSSIPFDISNLAKGQYLISVGEKSVKIVKE